MFVEISISKTKSRTYSGIESITPASKNKLVLHSYKPYARRKREIDLKDLIRIDEEE